MKFSIMISNTASQIFWRYFVSPGRFSSKINLELSMDAGGGLEVTVRQVGMRGRLRRSITAPIHVDVDLCCTPDTQRPFPFGTKLAIGLHVRFEKVNGTKFWFAFFTNSSHSDLYS